MGRLKCPIARKPSDSDYTVYLALREVVYKGRAFTPISTSL